MPTYKTKEELEKLQLDGLKWTVKHVYEGSEFYRQRLDEAGVKPEDIKTLADIEKLPFVTSYDLAGQYPFPLRSVPFADIVRIHASSGTTGKRKVLCYTAKDVEDWRRMFARVFEVAGCTTEDRVQIAVGYGLWTAGVGFQAGVEEFGAMAIPIGPGNLDLQTEFLVDLQTTVVCCTASMALLMAEQVNERGIKDKIAIKKVILGSERHSAAMDAAYCRTSWHRRFRDLRHPRHDRDCTVPAPAWTAKSTPASTTGPTTSSSRSWIRRP